MNFSDRIKSEYQKSGPDQTSNIREIAHEIADKGKQKMLSSIERIDRQQYIKRDVFGNEKLVVPITKVYVGEHLQDKPCRGHVSKLGDDGEIYGYQTSDKNDFHSLVELISEICHSDNIKVSLQKQKGSTILEKDSFYVIFELRL